jgi:hypothetical protein
MKSRLTSEPPIIEGEESPDATQIKIEALPLLAAGKEKPRQKRWAPKLKTGCKTCRLVVGQAPSGIHSHVDRNDRARRVKCDETRPFCKQCTSRGKWCGGYALDQAVMPASALRNSLTLAPILPSASSSDNDQVSVEPAPPSWHLMEAFRYCLLQHLHLPARTHDTNMFQFPVSWSQSTWLIPWAKVITTDSFSPRPRSL